MKRQIPLHPDHLIEIQARLLCIQQLIDMRDVANQALARESFIRNCVTAGRAALVKLCNDAPDEEEKRTLIERATIIEIYKARAHVAYEEVMTLNRTIDAMQEALTLLLADLYHFNPKQEISNLDFDARLLHVEHIAEALHGG